MLSFRKTQTNKQLKKNSACIFLRTTERAKINISKEIINALIRKKNKKEKKETSKLTERNNK